MEQDQAFLDALQKVRDKKIEHLIPQIDLLLENKITSLKSLYKLVDNPLADVDLRASACTILGSLCKAHYEHEKSIIDKRRALPIVLRALVSPHDEVRKSALGALTRLDSKRGNKIIADIAFDRTDPRDLRNSALWQIGHVGNDTHIEPLLAILQDRSEQAWARKMALQSTAIIASSRKSTRGNDVSQIFYDIIRDETDSVSLRGDAIEQLASLPNTAYLPFFIQLLRHE
jgi:HEAT repeat protein